MNFKFLDRWYEGVKRMARHKNAEYGLAGVSFIESSIFPIPPDLMLIPMVQADRSKAWRYAFVCTVASVLGGLLGYAIGLYFFDAFAVPVFEKLGKMGKVEEFKSMVDAHGALAVFGAGLTPFPYKVITIMSGALKLNLGVFVIASIIARSLRFYLVAAIVWKFGSQAEALIKKHFALATVILFALCVAAWFGWKALHG